MPSFFSASRMWRACRFDRRRRSNASRSSSLGWDEFLELCDPQDRRDCAVFFLNSPGPARYRSLAGASPGPLAERSVRGDATDARSGISSMDSELYMEGLASAPRKMTPPCEDERSDAGFDASEPPDAWRGHKP